MKKARRWLDEQGVEYRFHNYRKDGLNPELLAGWVAVLGWEVLLNKRGTTWRQLADRDKQDIDAAKAIKLMLAHPAMIKRPVLVHDGGLEVGFSVERYQALFA